MRLTITPIPAFNDNYIWAIQNQNDQVYVVDPGDADPVKAWLADRKLTLAGILVTHHHSDHTGGLASLLDMASVPVYGPAGGHIKHITAPLEDGAKITVFDHVFEVMATPGHTLDHIVFYHAADNSEEDTPLLFCGDTLFAGGCGRIFEGNPQMMYTSLQRLAALPAATQVFCAHEYTLANLAFATTAEPGNRATAERQAKETYKRDQNRPTLPSTIYDEQRTNPFLRCHNPSLQTSVRDLWIQAQGPTPGSGIDLDTELGIFTALRRLKDRA